MLPKHKDNKDEENEEIKTNQRKRALMKMSQILRIVNYLVKGLLV